MATATATREYGLSTTSDQAHIVKRWKPNPNNYLAQGYVTLCGTAGSAYWKYTDDTIKTIPVCPKCTDKAAR